MKIAALFVFALGMIIGVALSSLSQTPAQQPTASLLKQVGTVKSVNNNLIQLGSDSGSDLMILVQDSTRIVRVAPGEKDLKNATSITLRDLQPGDRLLVRGEPGENGRINASAIIAMKISDLELRKQKEQEDWQKRGVAGIADSSDAASGTITASITSLTGKRTVTIRTTKHTVVRRYAPGSVRFDEAKPGTLAEIKPGDQVRARGDRSEDGSQLSAEEIVSGSFRNIAGSVASVDVSSNTLTVLDSATKKPVLVKVASESQLRNLPPEIAQRVAMRMSGGIGPGVGFGPGGAANTSSSMNAPPSTPVNGSARAEGGGGPSGGGAPPGFQQRRGDIQQLFSRLPTVSLSDMKKGDTVMMVATQSSGEGAVTAIKLLDGVEPILAAAPKSGRESMTLSPWNLGAGQGGDDTGQ